MVRRTLVRALRPLISMPVEPYSTDCGQLFSELVSFPSRSGKRITAYIDAPRRDLHGVPFVLMTPKYGETKKNSLQLAYYLAANGFAVLRFDFTNHVGESEGEMTAFTLPGAVEDIFSSLDYLERNFEADNVTVVSASLSSRCALRAAASDPRIARLVCLVGVVNLQYTLREMYLEDIIGTFQAGRHWGITDILGFNIDGTNFCGSAVASNMHDLAGTIRDAEGIEVPVTYFFAERDLWIDLTEVRRVFSARQNCRLVPVQGAMHEVRENPRVAEHAFRQVVLACQGRLDTADASVEAVAVPDRHVVFAQNRRERAQLRKAMPDTVDESSFWARYLKRYEILERADDYARYLALVGSLLGDFRAGTCVLDAGCGNGLFGVWLWMRLLRERDPAAVLPSTYVGIDLTAGGLSDSLRKHSRAQWDRLDEIEDEPTRRRMDFSYLRFDFDQLATSGPQPTLPFADGLFDKVCCSLVLSYLEQPELLLAELHRVMRPGAVLVLSSMKPFCDLSAIYRDFVEQKVGPDEVASARGLLHAAGQIKIKEEKGRYTFYLADELIEMTGRVGFVQPQSFSSLGNQANVVRVVRP